MPVCRRTGRAKAASLSWSGPGAGNRTSSVRRNHLAPAPRHRHGPNYAIQRTPRTTQGIYLTWVHVERPVTDDMDFLLLVCYTFAVYVTGYRAAGAPPLLRPSLYLFDQSSCAERARCEQAGIGA